MFSFHTFRRRFCGFCVLVAWLALGVSAVAGENFREQEVRLRDRMLQRAEAYLKSCDKIAPPRLAPYATVVRGLLQAGVSPDHPFLRTKIDVLLRLVPLDKKDVERQREIALLVRALRLPVPSSETSFARLARLFPSKQDASSLQAAIVSDHYNENYRRFGVIRLPRGFNPDRPYDSPVPQNDPGSIMVAVQASPNSSRSSDIGEISESRAGILSSCSSDSSRHAEVDRQIGFVLIAQTVRLRN